MPSHKYIVYKECKIEEPCKLEGLSELPLDRVEAPCFKKISHARFFSEPEQSQKVERQTYSSILGPAIKAMSQLFVKIEIPPVIMCDKNNELLTDEEIDRNLSKEVRAGL